MEDVKMPKPAAGDDSRYEGERPKFQFPPGSFHESIHAAKLAVMAECPYLRKTKSEGLKYTYKSEAALIKAIRSSMLRNGLTWAPVKVQLIESFNYDTKHGTKMFVVRISVRYRLTHGFTATDEECEAPGEASDSGDKAMAKAMTQAQKYALLQLFVMETGDDPDKSASVPGKTDAEIEAANRERESLARESIEKATTAERCDKLETSIRERFRGESQSRLLSQLDERRKSLAASASPKPEPTVPPASEPTSEQREAKAIDAIKVATESESLHKIELEVAKLTGSVFTAQQGTRLLAAISARRREIALTHKTEVKHGPAYEKANDVLRRAAGWTRCRNARDWVIGQWQKKQLEDVEAGVLIRASFDKEIGYSILPSQLDAIHRSVDQTVEAKMRQPLLEKIDARREQIASRSTLDVIKLAATQMTQSSHAEDVIKLIVSMNGQENAPLSTADAATALGILNPLAKKLLDEESKPAPSPLLTAVNAAEAAVANV